MFHTNYILIVLICAESFVLHKENMGTDCAHACVSACPDMYICVCARIYAHTRAYMCACGWLYARVRVCVLLLVPEAQLIYIYIYMTRVNGMYVGENSQKRRQSVH